MHIRVCPPANNDRGPRGIESMLDALHEANALRRSMTLEIGSHGKEIAYFAELPAELKSTFTEEIQDAYPGLQFEPGKTNDAEISETQHSACLLLTPDVLSIKTFSEFDDLREKVRHDPASGLLSLVRPTGTIRTSIAMAIRPASRRRMRLADKVIGRLRRRFPLKCLQRWHYANCASSQWRDQLLAAACRIGSRRGKLGLPDPTRKLDRHLFEVQIVLTAYGPQHQTKKLEDRVNELIGAFGRFTSATAWFRSIAIPLKRRSRAIPSSLMTAAELATIWHIPFATSEIAKLHRSGVRELEPPLRLPAKRIDGPDVTELGRVQYRGERRRFGIHADDLRRHMFLCGRTGTGKSTLIRSMVADAMQSGKNVCVIDPHGDLIDSILGDVPKSRTNDVILFSAAERDYPVAFNPLHCESAEQRPLVADSVVVSLKKMYGDSWGPRLEQILRNSVLALLEQPDSTLLSIQKLLTNKLWRASLISRISDPVIRTFWTDIFGSWNDRFREEAVSPVLNKLDAFLASPIARAITCQPRSTIRIRSILDNPRSIFLCNLSKGLIGEQTSNVLGSFLVAAIQTAALSRADLPEDKRSDVQIYIDEFHSFVSGGNSSFATILSESRKYRVSFAALATQFLEQIDEETLAAVFGNCGSTIVFRSGVRDSETLAQHLGGNVTPDDICNLPNFTAYAKLLIHGQPTRSPFLMTTVPQISDACGRKETVERLSRQRYGIPTTAVTPRKKSVPNI
jgi:hypothetical protein